MEHDHGQPADQPTMEHTGHAPADPHRQPLHAATHGGHGGHGEQGGPGDRATHDKHAGHDPEAFRRQFWLVLALTIPVVAWSEEVQMWLGYTAPAFPGSEWIPPLLGTVVFLYGGRVFLS